ncbi:MAG TPA: nucleotide sugar dehydrogenase [Steroidobacteraceae bacterium]|nr:nucleotide sugar dehydrogenase [Steroidobacteraceae bacterium]
MRISIFGLGYVGAVSAACLAERGHVVTGVDPNADKVDLINSGRAPVVEAELAELTRHAVAAKRLRATSDPVSAVLESEVTFVCVPTPSQTNGNLDFRFIERVCGEIGAALKDKRDFHVVVIRSTILPGTLKSLAIPTLERASGRRAGEDFGVCHNPEFLRESTAVADFRNPPKTVIGAGDPRSGEIVQSLYEGVPGPMIRCTIEVAEMVKYADNTWHATKVTFANEIGKICKSLGLDSHAVMDIFCKDAKLNLSPYYLKPGFAFGGSCLPKDLRAITYHARSRDVSTPLLNSLMFSNREQIEQGIEMVLATRRRKVGLLGFSFKAGTDDLRESPLVEVIERLLGKGFDLRLYDRNVNLAKLTGANREYIMKSIPHIERLMVASVAEVLDHADVIVIGNRGEEFAALAERLRPDQLVIDFVRIRQIEERHGKYAGICW